MESIDKKKAQIESFELLKEILDEQTKVTNSQHLPIFTTEINKEILQFFKDCFYRYYSLYEISMTKFVDVNIYTQNKYQKYNIPSCRNLTDH